MTRSLAVAEKADRTAFVCRAESCKLSKLCGCTVKSTKTPRNHICSKQQISKSHFRVGSFRGRSQYRQIANFDILENSANILNLAPARFRALLLNVKYSSGVQHQGLTIVLENGASELTCALSVIEYRLVQMYHSPKQL